jgi:hypothetical protein
VPTYKDLNQRHPSADLDRLEDLRALYEGDARLEKRVHRFLFQRPRERPERFELRKREAQYRNYLGPIIDYFASMLFTSKPILKAKTETGEDVTAPDKYWAKFKEDCDAAGTDLDAFFKARLTDAMVTRTGWLRVHMPQDEGQPPLNAADFESRGLGNGRLEAIDSAEVLDWDIGPDGALAFVMLHSATAHRMGPAGGRETIVETWQWLTRETVETYSLTWEAEKPPTPETNVPRIGEPAPHGFGRVPLVCLDLPPALWVASRLKSPQLAHFRKVNAQSWSLAATCYAMPVVKVQDPAEYVKQASGAGYEIVLQQDDEFTWEAPPADHFAALDTEIKAEKDEIFRIAHQMALGVENNAAAVGRSAESKASDAEATRVVLVAFSRFVKETIELVLDLISAARGEKLRWSVEGLDDFAALDIATLLENLKLLKEAGDIPSKTFQIKIKTRVAESLLRDEDEATKQTIRKEIADGTADPVEERQRELDAAAATFGPASSPERPGRATPSAQA